MTDQEWRLKRLKAITHIVHEYANFVSSAEMVMSGCDIQGVPFRPPINTHVSHAFYLNCRKLAVFFESRGSDADDVKASHYADNCCAALPILNEWRTRINKQLAHITYSRDVGAREIDREACKALYGEVKEAWSEFRKSLRGGSFEAEFDAQVRARKVADLNGEPSEFRFYDLD